MSTATCLSHSHEDHVVRVRHSGKPAWIHELDLDAVRGWDGHVASAGFTDAGLARQIQELFHWPPIPAAPPPALGRRRGPRDVPPERASARRQLRTEPGHRACTSDTPSSSDPRMAAG
jgi:hypothetical protein